MKLSAFISAILLTLTSCSSSCLKEKINQAGNAAGQVAGEFAEGAGKGLTKAFDIRVSLSPGLASRGIQLGKTVVTSDSAATDNLLVDYVIFNTDFEGTLTAKVFDEQNLEMGRVSLPAAGKASEARYLEFHFDRRTNIDSKNLVTIE